MKERLSTHIERLRTALLNENKNEVWRNVHQVADVGNRIGRLLPDSCLNKESWIMGDKESKKRYEEMVDEVEAHVTRGFDASFFYSILE